MLILKSLLFYQVKNHRLWKVLINSVRITGYIFEKQSKSDIHFSPNAKINFKWFQKGEHKN